MNIGDIVVGEMFSDMPHAIGLLLVTSPSRTVAGKTVVYPMASVVTQVYLKNKLIYLNVYTRLESSADLEWVKAASRQWVAATSKIN